MTGSSHMRVPDRDQLIEVIERWHQSFSESGGRRAADAEHSSATEAVRLVVAFFYECALPRDNPPKPEGLSDEAYAIARASRRVLRELGLGRDGREEQHLWEQLDRLIRSARCGGVTRLPRLHLGSESRRQELRRDPIGFVFAQIRHAGWAALKLQRKRKSPLTSFPTYIKDKDGKKVAFEDTIPDDKKPVPKMVLQRFEDSKDFVALPHADVLCKSVAGNDLLRGRLGLLLMREVAKYTEDRHDAGAYADLPVHGVPGITVGMWLEALELRTEVTAIDEELKRRYDDPAGPSQARVDGLSSVVVLEMLHELAGRCGTTCPWNNRDALDAAVLRAKKAIMEHFGANPPAGKQP